MAIDFGKLATGVATGYLQAKIQNTEANDRLKEDIVKRAGQNFYDVKLPEFQERERQRENTFKKISSIHGNDVAEYFDQQGFITGEGNDFATINDILSEKNNFNKDRLKAYLEGAQDGTYQSRKQKRFESMADQEKFVMGNLTKNQLGSMTVMNQLDIGKTQEQPMAPTETQAIAPVPPEDKEVDTTTKLPSFEDIFGDTSETAVDAFINLPAEDKTRIIDDADREFKNLFINPVSGALQNIPEKYRDDYNKLTNEEQKQTSFFVYTKDRHFREQFLPKMYGITYEPSAVKTARDAINYQRSIGNEEGVSEAKNILRSLGYDPNDYSF